MSKSKILNFDLEKNEKIEIPKINNKKDKNNKINLENETTSFDQSDIITIRDFKSKELMHYFKLDKFFNICTIEEIHKMIDIINGNHLISLRFLDWFVTRYCYLYKLSININNSYCKEANFNVNISYKAQLKSFKKKYFDPFRRKKKFYYSYENHNLSILTTLGQLNFFRWALNFDIIKYTENNYRDIISKLNHVNSYFKKNLIENNSYSTSDDILESLKSNTDSNEIVESLKSNTDSNENKSNNSDTLIVNNKNDDIIFKNKLKNKYKNPMVSRNIFLEF